jgi:hypothetical protein
MFPLDKKSTIMWIDPGKGRRIYLVVPAAAIFTRAWLLSSEADVRKLDVATSRIMETHATSRV